MTDQAARWQAWWDQTPAEVAATWAWRGVEAQHVVATMRLVDTLEEQALLERLLEGSKPAVPAEAGRQHYLLFTPFRYRSPQSSRFRTATDPGIWYGAGELETACAEVAWWRWRFVTDSAGLRERELLTEHTLFRARFEGLVLDLLQPPWSAAGELWSGEDYRPAQALARAFRGRSGDWIRYGSARRAGGTCCAVLVAPALVEIDLAGQQTWHCRATVQGVRMVHDRQGLEWSFDTAASSSAEPGRK